MSFTIEKTSVTSANQIMSQHWINKRELEKRDTPAMALATLSGQSGCRAKHSACMASE